MAANLRASSGADDITARLRSTLTPERKPAATTNQSELCSVSLAGALIEMNRRQNSHGSSPSFVGVGTLAETNAAIPPPNLGSLDAQISFNAFLREEIERLKAEIMLRDSQNGWITTPELHPNHLVAQNLGKDRSPHAAAMCPTFKRVRGDLPRLPQMNFPEKTFEGNINAWAPNEQHANLNNCPDCNRKHPIPSDGLSYGCKIAQQNHMAQIYPPNRHLGGHELDLQLHIGLPLPYNQYSPQRDIPMKPRQVADFQMNQAKNQELNRGGYLHESLSEGQRHANPFPPFINGARFPLLPGLENRGREFQQLHPTSREQQLMANMQSFNGGDPSVKQKAYMPKNHSPFRTARSPESGNNFSPVTSSTRPGAIGTPAERKEYNSELVRKSNIKASHWKKIEPKNLPSQGVIPKMAQYHSQMSNQTGAKTVQWIKPQNCSSYMLPSEDEMFLFLGDVQKDFVKS